MQAKMESTKSTDRRNQTWCDVHIYLGELQIFDLNKLSLNEKVEYQAVVTIGAEDPVEMIDRAGRLGEDIAFGRRASTRVPSRISTSKGELNHHIAPFHQTLFIPNAVPVDFLPLSTPAFIELTDEKIILWIVRLAFSAADDFRKPLSSIKPNEFLRTGDLTSNLYNYSTLPISSESYSHLSVSTHGQSKQIVRRHPLVSIVGICFLNPDPPSENHQFRLTSLKGQNPVHIAKSDIFPLDVLPKYLSPEFIIGNSNGYLTSLVLQPIVEKVVPLGSFSCESVLVANSRPSIPEHFLRSIHPGLEVDPRIAARGVMVRIVRVSGIPLDQLHPESKEVVNGKETPPDLQRLFGAVKHPQRLEIYWSAKGATRSSLKTSKRAHDIEKLENAINLLRNMGDSDRRFSRSLREWGRKVIWSSHQIELGPLTGQEFIDEPSANRVAVDLNYGSTVFMMLPPEGHQILNCSIYIEALRCEKGDMDKTVIAEFVEPIDISQISAQALEIPLVSRDIPKQLMGSMHLVINRVPQYGVFTEQGTFKEIQLDPYAIIPECSLSDPYSSPPLNLGPSPFSCPKCPLVPKYPILDHSIVPMIFSEDSSTGTVAEKRIKRKGSVFRQMQGSRGVETGSVTDSTSPHNSLIHSHIPIPQETWVIGGNPRGGITGIPQKFTVTSRPYFVNNKEVVQSDGHSIEDSTEKRCDSAEQNSSEEKENVKSRICPISSTTSQTFTGFEGTRSRILGSDIASWLRLRLISIPQRVDESNENSAITKKWTTFSPEVIPFEWRVTPNDDDTCNVEYIVPTDGRFHLYVDLHGVSIAGSPFEVLFVAGYPNPQATRILSPNEPSKCYASSLRAVEFERPIRLDQEIGGIKGGIQRFERALDSIGVEGKYYVNEIQIRLHDSSGTPLSSGGHLVSARSNDGVDVVSVIDLENGIYCISFVVALPYDKGQRKTFKPQIEITLDQVPIFGSPFQLNIQNEIEIIELYRKVDELYEAFSPEAKIKRSDFENPFAVAGQIEKLGKQNQEYFHKRLVDLERAAEELAITGSDETKSIKWLIDLLKEGQSLKNQVDIELKVEEAMGELQHRWLALQDFRSQLCNVQKELQQANISQSTIGEFLQQFSAKTERSTLLLLGDIASLENLKRIQLDPLVSYYKDSYYSHSNALTIKLIQIIDAINSKNYDTLESFLQLHQQLAAELRNLHRYDLATMIEDAIPLIIEEIDLRGQKFTLDWKETKLDQLDDILRKKELNLQFVANNFKESRRTISATGSSNKSEPKEEELTNEVWEAPPQTEDVEIQTEDPSSSLDTVLGPMIVYRATGQSPAPNIPRDEDSLQLLSRNAHMGSTLKKYWMHPKVWEIQGIRKLLKSCPRLRVALEETFHSFSFSTLESLQKDLRDQNPSPGISWESFKRFCRELNLSNLLLDDVVALRHLFHKFSFENRSKLSSSFGFVRQISFSLWIGFLRELAFLDTIAECISSDQTFYLDRLTRLEAFHYFITNKFLDFYGSLSVSFSQPYYYPLLPPVQEKDETKDIVSIGLRRTKIQSLEDMKKFLRGELCHLFNYDLLKQQFEERSIKEPMEEAEMNTGETELAMPISKFISYVLDMGLTPTYVRIETCRATAEDAVQQYQSKSKTKMSFETFVIALSELLISLLEINLDSSRSLDSIAQEIVLQMTELLSLLNLINNK